MAYGALTVFVESEMISFFRRPLHARVRRLPGIGSILRYARLSTAGFRLARKIAALAAAPFFLIAAGTATQNAVANGDTRTITIFHEHTKETTTATFRVNGSYDSAALKKLNWALRDWRIDESTEMDPRLFDVVWEVYRELGASEVHVVSAYRSPGTNAMLRRRSRAVAKNSQHMAGKAMDSYVPGVSMAKVREIGMRLQRGGVGYYPTAGHPFVHLDVGSVRHWPKMSYDQLARIFPDGKTVHIPSNGQPMARYDEARAEIERSGGSAYAASEVTGKSRGLFAALFGGGEDDEEDVVVRSGRGGRKVASLGRPGARENGRIVVASSGENGDAGSKTFFANVDVRSAAPDAPARTAVAARPAKPQLLDAPAAAVVAASGDETPAATPKAAAVAKLEAARPDAKADTKAPAAPANEESAAKVASVPAPPRRPGDLRSVEIASANVPLPPSRPVELAALVGAAPVKSDAATTTVAALATPVPPVLPREITGAPRRPVAANALAFAAPGLAGALPHPAIAPLRAGLPGESVPLPPTKPDFTAVRLDRANFRALTAAAPAARTPSQTGAAAQPMRATARNDVLAMALMPESGVAGTFSQSATGDLSAEAFTGPAIKPFATAGLYVEMPTGSITRKAK